ncbi:hypothetical protein [Dactylosporangium sp. CS-033363]|uniref:hypothetical protein n=1 Tax=Dactylosporangium sp. CS-033363 TaxID=3239935 RepID=UPI003D8DBB9C
MAGPASTRTMRGCCRCWTGLALGWLEHGFPTAEVMDDLAALKDAPDRGQPIRHRALRVYRKAL